MLLVMAKRNGFKRNTKISSEKVSDVMRDIRKAANLAKKQKMSPPNGQETRVGPVSPRATRVAGSKYQTPEAYRDIDYLERESELRLDVNGPWHEWDEVPPQEDCPEQPTTCEHPDASSDEWLHIETKRFAESTNNDPSLQFLTNCTPRMSAFLKARVLQDIFQGVQDVNDSIANGLAVALKLGMPALQEESTVLLETNLRPGRGASAESDNRRNVKFDNTHQMAGHTVTRVALLNTKWDVYD